MNEISKETAEKLQKWADKLKVDKEYVMERFFKHLETYKDEKKARIKTIGDLEEEFGSLVSNAPTWYVYILSDSGLVNMYELMRNKARNMYNDPQRHDESIDKGYITEDGTPLDYREKVFGKINENKGMPLTGDSYQRAFFGIVSSAPDFSKPLWAEIVANGEHAKNFNGIATFKFYRLRANQSRTNPNRLSLGSATKFLEFEPEITNAEIGNKILSIPTDTASLKREFNEHYAGKKRVSHITVLQGEVSKMLLQPFNGSRIFILTEEDNGSIRCKIHESIPITFQETDTLIVFCRLFPNRQGDISAQVRAYMVM